MGELPISLEVIGQAAQRKMPAGWRWCIWTRAEGGCVVKGGIPERTITRGPNKGAPNWKGVKLQSVVVSDDDAKAEFLRQEAESGQCRKCQGSGQQTRGWSSQAGIMWEPCTRCDATGKSP